MAYGHYFNLDSNDDRVVLPVYGGEDGMGWVGASAGPGTIALSGGGVPVVRHMSGGGWTDVVYNVPVYTRPSASDASTIEIGLAVPDGGIMGLRDSWVIYWEED